MKVYCAGIGFSGVKGRAQGDWYLPSMEEIATLLAPVSYPAPNASASAADELNRGLAKISGSQVGNGAHFWTSCRYNTNSAWIFNGYNGGAYGSYFYNGSQALPVALFELGTSEE